MYGQRERARGRESLRCVRLDQRYIIRKREGELAHVFAFFSSFSFALLSIARQSRKEKESSFSSLQETDAQMNIVSWWMSKAKSMRSSVVRVRRNCFNHANLILKSICKSFFIVDERPSSLHTSNDMCIYKLVVVFLSCVYTHMDQRLSVF